MRTVYAADDMATMASEVLTEMTDPMAGAEKPMDTSTEMALNARDLEREFSWFTRVLDIRFALYFDNQADSGGIAEQFVDEVMPPDLSTATSAYADFVRRYRLDFDERIAVALALAPHLQPSLLDIFHTKNKNFERKFTEFGGLLDAHGDFIPTGETLAFVLAGSGLYKRLMLPRLFEQGHTFSRHHLLYLDIQHIDMPLLKAPLRLSDDGLGQILGRRPQQQPLTINFPARPMQTSLEWGDLVLHPGTLAQVREIEVWLRHRDTLMNDWAMASKLRPGYRALFYGPPGTGKTMTACLLGKATQRDVYKVDLSLVVSKYIGETEKNLARVFDQAQQKQWLLFFDEADALFGKRGDTQNSHDRYANQEVSFLLQRIETFDGIAILASNLKDNLDAAFARRFESVIYFPAPRREERLRLWRQGFSAKAQLDDAIALDKIAAEHELCGGAIINVVHYASLQALEQGDNRITLDILQRGIRREKIKQGKAG